MEDRVRQALGSSSEILGNGGILFGRKQLRAESRAQIQKRLLVHEFVDRNAEATIRKQSEVDACGVQPRADCAFGIAGIHRDRVEERFLSNLESRGTKRVPEPDGPRMHTRGDGAQTLFAVEHGV